MGLFTRRDRAPGQHATSTTRNRSGGVYEPYPMNRRPGFGFWLKHTWLDLLTMVLMGALGLGIYMAKPAPDRSFAVTFQDGEIVYPAFAYPLRKEIVPIWLAAFLAFMIPFVVFLFVQIRVRSFWDLNNATIGVLYSLITAAVFQVFLKWLIGGLRPHFLTVCKPDISKANNVPLNAVGYNQIYFTREICTGDEKEINDSLESFPSGHTTAAFAGFVFLYLYLNAKLKVFANYHPSMWKLLAIYAPILGAVLIGGALTIDAYHHYYDVMAGAFIGTTMAFSSYRMTYAAIWDWRFNHIPLSRAGAFSFGSEATDMELIDSVFTHRAGWGTRNATSSKGGMFHRSGQSMDTQRTVGGAPARGEHMV